MMFGTDIISPKAHRHIMDQQAAIRQALAEMYDPLTSTYFRSNRDFLHDLQISINENSVDRIPEITIMSNGWYHPVIEELATALKNKEIEGEITMGPDSTCISFTGGALYMMPMDFYHASEAFKQEIFNIQKVIFNDPATIIIWQDGSRTVVKCGEYEIFDPEKGIAMCLLKKILGNKGNYNNIIKEVMERGGEQK